MTSEIYGNVSRETLDRFEQLADLVRKWSRRINLISKRDLEVVEQRHIADSLQLWPLRGSGPIWLDIGSGGGFPALPLAILALEKDPELSFICIESDQRKCAFLRTAARELSLNLKVKSERIEAADPVGANTLSARALADLSTLFSFADRHLFENGHAIFPKGETWKKEVEDARQDWNFMFDAHTSETSQSARLLLCKEIKRV